MNNDLSNSYLNRDLILSQSPKYLVLELTNICNLSCIMCPYPKMKRDKGFMDFNLYKKIIDNSIGKVEFIYLHFFGEPFLHKDIFKYIEYASSSGITLALSTNATIFNDELIDKILNSSLDFMILSLDSINKETYEKIRVGGKFEKTYSNIINILEKHKSNNRLNIVLQMVKMNLNKQEEEEFVKRFKVFNQRGFNLTIKGVGNYAGEIKRDDVSNTQTLSLNNRVCYEPWRGFTIGWDGKVVPCCNDFNYSYILGDLNTSSIDEIWNSDEMMNFRKKQIDNRQKDIKLCKNCDIPTENEITIHSLYSSFNPSQKELLIYFNKGLYQHELSDDYENLWTKKEFELLIQHKFKDIKISFINSNPQKEELKLSVNLYGEYIATFVIYRHSEITLPILEKYRGRLLRYEFSVDNTWIPKKEGLNEDSRELGVNIQKIIN